MQVASILGALLIWGASQGCFTGNRANLRGSDNACIFKSVALTVLASITVVAFQIISFVVSAQVKPNLGIVVEHFVAFEGLAVFYTLLSFALAYALITEPRATANSSEN